MRDTKEMMELILNIAKSDEGIRGVLLNGSRANPNVAKDIYQDYDIAFIVTDVNTFTKDHSWIDIFGSRLILQMPETMRYPEGPPGCFTYLMLFTDGNRIDLSLVPTNSKVLEEYEGLTIKLLDKDGNLPEFPPPTDQEFWLKEPDELFFYSCCNNFWWCLNNVAKGIARDELAYVMNMLNLVVRPELHLMIGYYIGMKHSFNLSVGKDGKFYKHLLPQNLYQKYAATYSGSNYPDIWASIYTMCDLFHTLAIEVAKHFGFTYRQGEEDGSRIYLDMIKQAADTVN